MASGQRKFLLVSINYFTKWIEAKAPIKITTKQVIEFFWENVICMYELQRILVTDNGLQFNNEKFMKYYDNNDIDLRFTLVAHPQDNGKAEVANRIIMYGLKKRVEHSRNNWVEELLLVLWAYRTFDNVIMRATQFLLAYGTEFVVPLEITHVSTKVEAFDPETNEEGMRLALNLIDEVRDEANARIVEYHKRTSSYYNLKVKGRAFKEGDLVLRKIEASGVGQKGKLAPN